MLVHNFPCIGDDNMPRGTRGKNKPTATFVDVVYGPKGYISTWKRNIFAMVESCWSNIEYGELVARDSLGMSVVLKDALGHQLVCFAELDQVVLVFAGKLCPLLGPNI
ncbi:unnamed protein product [Prorocentrum cordatum]|uniref:Uncharacterized protein n=1 Tax=Prorocentrum cordatum TaxID=2364126 RepID=A0ABN9UNK2_9DINO|nr:unnamed protein product [Polarella glacialis]